MQKDDKKIRLDRKEDNRRSPRDQEKNQFQWKKSGRTLILWIALIVLSILLFQYYSRGKKDIVDVSYSEFQQQLEQSNIKSVLVIEKNVEGEFVKAISKSDGGRTQNYARFRTYLPVESQELISQMQQKGVQIEAQAPSVNWSGMLLTSLPWILLLAFFWFFLFRQMQGSSKGIFSFGKSRARLLTGDRPKITFEDVAGADEAKQE
ncbi:MAG: ATP-dependent metallopeptidase FtsH/Yme1/Tma family protein, partial [candidate division Zixibacteria bacterium]|nr:ATP-dependent metallopeptidase FtsH/Yme1/Tma family protein [candidate division Zixibacteria bacterium]